MKKSLTLLLPILICLQASAEYQYLSPMPGSRYHNVNRTITIREGSLLDPRALHNRLFSMVGTLSGTHEFETVLASDGKTIILKPTREFSFGEMVTITVSEGLQSSEGKILEGITFSFQTHPARSAEDEKRLAAARQTARELEFGPVTVDQGATTRDNDYFTINVNENPSPGQVFFSSFGYNVIGWVIENNGDALLEKITSRIHFDFKLNHNGYFTAFNGKTGFFDVMDSNFVKVAGFLPGNGYYPDVHDFLIYPDNHKFFIIYDYQVVDMTVYDSTYYPYATVAAGVIQELDENNNVLLEWRGWDYVDIPEGLHENLAYSYIDYMHVNSIDIDNDGNIIFSSRHLDQINKIDRITGDFIWRLGGINNQFTFVNDPEQFNYTHYARRIANGNLTIHDNGNYHFPARSYAKEYQLDETNKTATLVWSYHHPNVNGYAMLGGSMGSTQRLPNGNTLINWGGVSLSLGHPSITEVDAAGKIVWELSMNDIKYHLIYRAHRYDWDPCARASRRYIKAMDITNNSAKITWFAANGAESYELQYRETGTTTWTTVAISGTTAQTLQSLLPSTNYEYRIQTLCDGGSQQSGYTEIKDFTTLPLKEMDIFSDEEYACAFPNPSDGKFQLVIPDSHGTFTIEVFGSTGMRMLSIETITEGEDNVIPTDCSSWADGIYLYSLQGEGISQTGKLVIAR